MKLDKKTMRRIMYILFSAITFCALLLNIETVLSVLGKAITVLMPVIIGLCIAFLLNPLADFGENKLFGFVKRRFEKNGKGLSRALGTLFALIVLFGVVTILVVVVIPDVKEATKIIGETLPGTFEMIVDYVEGVLGEFGLELPSNEGSIDWVAVAQEIVGFFDFESGSTLINNIINATSSVIGAIFDFVMGFVVAIYVLLQREQIGAFFRRFIKAYCSEKSGNRFFKIANLSAKSFRSFVSGQLLEAVIIGVLCFVGMLIFRFPYALATSAVICFTALIPVFGAWIGGILGAVLALTESPFKALLFIVFIIVLQQLEGNLIYPKVVGKSIGLPGILVFLSVLLGGNLYGIVGMLFAVPLCSIGYTLVKQAIDERLKEKAKKEQKEKKAKAVKVKEVN